MMNFYAQILSTTQPCLKTYKDGKITMPVFADLIVSKEPQCSGERQNNTILKQQNHYKR